MFDLFLALFGGAYYATKIRSEKRAHKKIEQNRKERTDSATEDFNHWVTLMVDEDLEYRIPLMLKQNPELTFSKIADDVNQIGIYPQVKSYDELLYAIRNSEFKLKDEEKNIIRMLLAKEGKLMKDDAWFSFLSPEIWDYTEKQRWIRHHKFMKWLDKELQSHGVEPMLFWCNHKKAPLSGENGTPIDSIDEPTYGLYYWNSSRFYANLV